MKVAFATKDLENVNDHFGWAKQFAIYDITNSGYSLAEVVKTEEDHFEEDDKIASKINAIEGCSILYCEAIGPNAAAKVIKAKIHPIKVKEATTIEAACQQLQAMLGGNGFDRIFEGQDIVGCLQGVCKMEVDLMLP